MTCPHIGNYGVTPEDVESTRIWAEGFVVKEASNGASNWRSQQGLQDYLKAAKIVGIEGLIPERSPGICVSTAPSRASSPMLKAPERAVEKARQAPDIDRKGS